MKNSKFIDLYLGKFQICGAISVLILAVLSIPQYDGLSLRFLDNFGVLERVRESFNIIALNRENQSRSVFLMWVAIALSFFSFITYMWTLPASALRDKYLKSWAIRNYLVLAFYFVFFGAITVGMVCIGFVVKDWSDPGGKFARAMAIMIRTDLGLAVYFAILLEATLYVLAILLKTILVHVGLIKNKGI